MEVFWERGYAGASLRDLEARMGINRFSLYATFDSKHELFLRALDRYSDTVAADRWLRALEAPDASLPAIRERFQAFVRLAGSGETAHGCLMTNSAIEVAPRDERAAARVCAHLARLEDAFYRALVRAVEKGELEGARDLRAVARHLTACAQGLLVLARLGHERGFLQDVADSALSALR